MHDSTLPRLILLPELRFKQSYVEHHTLICECEKKQVAEICPKCATPSSVTYDHRWVQIKDEPVRRTKCVLRIKKRRLYCKRCKKPFMEPVAGILPRQRTTQRLKRAVLWAAETFTSLESVERFYRCSTSLIYSTVFAQLELKLRKYDYPWPKVIGIDEHFFRRENEHRRYFTIFVDIKNHRPREALLGKKKERLEEKLEHIEGRENVRWAVIDLSSTYRKLIREYFPKAKIVADKFHVLRLFTKALRIVRHQIKHDLKKRPHLRLLLKSRRKLDYFQRQALDRQLKGFPELNEAYRIKEESMTFYRIKGHRRAERALARLLERLERCQLQPMKRLANTLRKWREEILNYFVTGLTNAMSEGFNRVASLVKNRGFGYRNPKYYRLRFLSACL